MPGSSVIHYLLEFDQICDTIQPSHPLPSPSPFAFNLSQHQGLFRWVSSSHQVPKYWSFSISPSNEYSGLISFRIDSFDLFAVQYHNLKAFFMVQLSYLYMTTEKAIALTRWIFVSKVMSLLFNMSYRFIIAFLPRSKHLLISLM